LPGPGMSDAKAPVIAEAKLPALSTSSLPLPPTPAPAVAPPRPSVTSAVEAAGAGAAPPPGMGLSSAAGLVVAPGETVYEGACFCRRVKVRAAGTPLWAAFCACTVCAKVGASTHQILTVRHGRRCVNLSHAPGSH
jgi:hypothetical protein